jgi:hypothetical protein
MRKSKLFSRLIVALHLNEEITGHRLEVGDQFSLIMPGDLRRVRSEEGCERRQRVPRLQREDRKWGNRSQELLSTAPINIGRPL